MKKCDVFTECVCAQHVVMKLDLRVESEKRVAEVARAIVPLKETIGCLHVSTSLAFQENGVTKYCNLPVVVTENEQERIVKLLFPADLCVTIWMNGAEQVINGLEYHVDKRTEVVTEVINDSKTFQPVPGRIQLSFNVKDVTEKDGLNSDAVLNSLMAQAQQVRDWNQPIDLVLIEMPGKSFLMAEVMEVRRQYVASQLQLTIRARRPNNLIPKIGREIMELLISVGSDGVEVAFSEEIAFIPNLIFLYEDGNGIISLLDSDEGGASLMNWEWFASALEAKQHPAVYLCSPNSGCYCPVTYQVFKDELNVINRVLMEISYYREVGGHLELWTEQRDFNGLPTTGATYAGSEEGTLKIRKVVLGIVQ